MLERHLEAALGGAATGKRYQIDIKKLTPQEQQELWRLIQDFQQEINSVKHRARQHPFRPL